MDWDAAHPRCRLPGDDASDSPVNALEGCPGRKSRRIVRQALVGADHQCSARRQDNGYAPEDFPLEIFLEIGESQVPAEHKIEFLRGRLAANVLEHPSDSLPESVRYPERGRPKASGDRQQLLGKFAQRTPWEGSLAGAIEQPLIDFGCDDFECALWKPQTHVLHPEEPEGVGFLTGGAPGTPGPQEMLFPIADQPGEDGGAERVKYGPVAVESGDRDAAEPVEAMPLIRFRLQVAAIGVKIRQLQLGDSASQSLAHLQADPSEAPPAQT